MQDTVRNNVNLLWLPLVNDIFMTVSVSRNLVNSKTSLVIASMKQLSRILARDALNKINVLRLNDSHGLLLVKEHLVGKNSKINI
jgi:hypothetical protein